MDTTLNGSRKQLIKRIIVHKELYLLFIPVAAWYIIFCYVPMAGLVIAFKNFSPLRGISSSPWIGLKTFESLMELQSFSTAFTNTLIFSFQKIIFAFPIPIIFALLINEMANAGLKRFVQTVSYLPHFISWSAAGGIIYMLLAPQSGALNNLLMYFGGEGQNYIGISAYFRRIVLFSHIWKSMGWSAIVYLAAVTGVDEQLYEAAYIDGAGRLQRIWHITIPGIIPTICVMLIMQMGNILNISFDQIFILANDRVLDVAETIDYFVYRVGLSSANNFSQATAAGMIKSLIGLVLVVITNMITKKMSDGEGGIW